MADPVKEWVEIGRRLEAVRRVLGIQTKKQFAEDAGIGEQTYGPWANGRREISKDGVKKLIARYGLTWEYIYFGNKDDLPHKIAKDL